MDRRKLWLVLVPITGVILLVCYYVILFDQGQRVWVEKAQNQFPFFHPSKEFADWWQKKYDNGTRLSESYDPTQEFLAEKGVAIYNSKTEYRQELAQICEALGCRTGYVKMYLISKKDVPELNKLGYH